MAVHRFPSPSPSLDVDTLGERMERLRHDANALASEHTNIFLQSLTDTASLADQLANGGEAYQIGVREIARRAHADLAATVLSLRAVLGKAH
jgi:hypothetical protein